MLIFPHCIIMAIWYLDIVVCCYGQFDIHFYFMTLKNNVIWLLHCFVFLKLIKQNKTILNFHLKNKSLYNICDRYLIPSLCHNLSWVLIWLSTLSYSWNSASPDRLCILQFSYLSCGDNTLMEGKSQKSLCQNHVIKNPHIEMKNFVVGWSWQTVDKYLPEKSKNVPTPALHWSKKFSPLQFFLYMKALCLPKGWPNATLKGKGEQHKCTLFPISPHYQGKRKDR